MCRVAGVLAMAFLFVLGLGYPTQSAWAASPNGAISVEFRSLDAGQTRLLGGLRRPAGDGPFPAIVLLHTCGGMQSNDDDWAVWFVQAGYLTLQVDSFGPRRVQSTCTGGTPTQSTRAFDALGALDYLRTRTDVQADHIGALGWSHGAGTALFADTPELITQSHLRGSGFVALVALYPSCPFQIREIASPLMILIGSADDWTSALDCQLLAQRVASDTAPVQFRVYPDVWHRFDDPHAPGLRRYGPVSHNLVYNEAATRDAHQRIATFFATYLRATP